MSRRDSDLDYYDWLDRYNEPRQSSRVEVCYQHKCVRPCEECGKKRVEDHIERSRRLRCPA